MQGWNGEAALPMICHPTLLIWGDQDRTYPWAQVRALWQGNGNCQLAEVPGCAHAVHMDGPIYSIKSSRAFWPDRAAAAPLAAAGRTRALRCR